MKVEILRSAQKEIERIDSDVVVARIKERILGLAEDPMPRDSLKLTQADGYRIRVGDYRIIYTVDFKQAVVRVIAVRHRREAYR